MARRFGGSAGLALVVALLLASCGLGGQSGTEGGMREHCVCEVSWNPGRAIVEALDGRDVTLRVESWLDEAALAPPGLAPGDSFTAKWAPVRECGEGVTLAAGDLVLFDVPGGGRASCEEFVTCGEGACGDQPEPSPPEGSGDDVGSTPLDDWYECADEACAQERGLCAQDYSSTWLRLARWSEESEVWSFGEGTDGPWTAPDDGVAELLNGEGCDAAFPYDPGCDVYENGRPACD